MDDLKRVIDALEQCLNTPRCQDCSWESCEKAECPRTELPMDLVIAAIELLKAQEPRVMTLEEVEAMPYGHVLIETDKKDSLRWLDALLFSKNANYSFDFITLEGRARLLGTEYNHEWRCWTSCPTDEQREAVKWDGNA